MTAGGQAGHGVRAVAVAFAVAALTLAGCSRGSYRVTAVFDDSGDLQTRGAVQVADVRVGTIGHIELTRDFRSKVTMDIHSGTRIPRASLALLRTTSLLGERFVELRPEGDPGAGPWLADGDAVARTEEAADLESVAEQAVVVLGAVSSDDVARVVETGAEAVAGRGGDLRALVDDLARVSATLAGRTAEITRIIDSLGHATATLAGGSDEVGALLAHLAAASGVLADNRQRAVTALEQLSRLARSQNVILDRYRDDISRQVKQVDTITAAAAAQTNELGTLLDWLERFTVAVPKVVPHDYTQIFMWAVPAAQDPRSGAP